MFIPVGYLYKKIVLKPDWLAANVDDICSVSGCVSENFTDYINYWLHNGYWLFDSPQIMQQIAQKEALDISSMQLHFYEAYTLAYDEHEKQWISFEPDASFITNIQIPQKKQLLGFDVVTFSGGNIPECSPLSCNHLAAEIAVNRHCLFDRFEDAKQALEQGVFDNSEPGPFRIYAVYQVEQ